MIDPRADISQDARISSNVSVGPWSIIGPDVEIGEGTEIGSHVIIKGPTKIGQHNKVYSFCSIGEDPQDLKWKGEKTYLEIGDHNVIREFCTLNRGTVQGGGVTRIGNHNLIMAYVHIAHDCRIGHHNILANNAALSGHVVVEDYTILSGYSAIHQYCIIGAHSFVAAVTYVSKDVLPYVLVSGREAEACGLNLVGLKRKGFTTETINYLKRAYKIIFRNGLTVAQTLEQLGTMVTECSEIQIMMDALKKSERGIVR